MKPLPGECVGQGRIPGAILGVRLKSPTPDLLVYLFTPGRLFTESWESLTFYHHSWVRVVDAGKEQTNQQHTRA